MPNLKTRWPLATAEAVAQELMELLAPTCERIAVAGSIRRQRPDPSDIELLCIPKPTESMIFYQDALDQFIRGVPQVLTLRPNRRGGYTYGLLNKLLLHIESGIPVDVFSTNERNWGLSLLVRTGPAEWNIRYMARLKALGRAGHAYGGVTLEDGTDLACPTEEIAFSAAGWNWIEPSERR